MPVPSDKRISRTASGSGICQCMAGYLFPPGLLPRWIVPNPVLRARWVRQTNLDFSKEPIICSPSGTGFVNGPGRGKGKMTVRQAIWGPCRRQRSGRREKASHHLHTESWAAKCGNGGITLPVAWASKAIHHQVGRNFGMPMLSSWSKAAPELSSLPQDHVRLPGPVLRLSTKSIAEAGTMGIAASDTIMDRGTTFFQMGSTEEPERPRIPVTNGVTGTLCSTLAGLR